MKMSNFNSQEIKVFNRKLTLVLVWLILFNAPFITDF